MFDHVGECNRKATTNMLKKEFLQYELFATYGEKYLFMRWKMTMDLSNRLKVIKIDDK